MPNHETIRELITFDNRILEMVTDDSLLNVAVDDRIDIATIISDREITFDDLKIYYKDIILIISFSMCLAPLNRNKTIASSSS